MWHKVLIQPNCVFLIQICFWRVNFLSGYMPSSYRTVVICPNHTKSMWKSKGSKEKSSVSAYSLLNTCSWRALSFTDEEQYLWNQSPRSQCLVTRCLDLVSCSRYSPVFANCSVRQMPAPTRWCHCSSAWVQDLSVQNNSYCCIFVFCGPYGLGNVSSALWGKKRVTLKYFQEQNADVSWHCALPIFFVCSGLERNFVMISR